MNTYPKISIVTPSYNQGAFIEQTIQSIVNQHYPNLEYIIIDGGSTDNTVNIIKKYAQHITYWVSEADNGQSHAINKGIAKCSGDIFNWINSDDFLEPDSLFHIAEEYSKNPFAVLCGRVNVFDNSTFSHVRKPSFIGKTTEESIAYYNINQEGTWWNLPFVKNLKGVNEAFECTMDLDLWIRFLLSYPIDTFKQTDVILSNFRRHAAAKSTMQSTTKFENNQFLKEAFVIFNEFVIEKDFYFNLLQVEKPTTKICLHYTVSDEQKQRITELFLFKLLQSLYYAKDFKRAKKCLKGLKKINNTQNISDIRYLKRRLLFKF